ncbi:hypothetical protein Raf01_44770 [Rugosimonospora africana]|uniref:Uncharacterized protein n=1 Tax=Rugosimonospora africana TaxID=556532 RepID=A0A8J3QRS5_9ACTN|nr:hypothetical protein Raf01_44770 [Rugosimonospora africana]
MMAKTASVNPVTLLGPRSTPNAGSAAPARGLWAEASSRIQRVIEAPTALAGYRGMTVSRRGCALRLGAKRVN